MTLVGETEIHAADSGEGLATQPEMFGSLTLVGETEIHAADSGEGLATQLEIFGSLTLVGETEIHPADSGEGPLMKVKESLVDEFRLLYELRCADSHGLGDQDPFFLLFLTNMNIPHPTATTV